MTSAQEFFADYGIWVFLLIVAALALTIFIFRRRKFDRGYRKGSAADPQAVRDQNPPDEWSRSH